MTCNSEHAQTALKQRVQTVKTLEIENNSTTYKHPKFQLTLHVHMYPYQRKLLIKPSLSSR